MRPSTDELQELYYGQELTSRAIGKRYGVSHGSVLRWLRVAGFERRAIGRGLANRGIVEPTRDELIDMIHVQHLGYAGVAAIYGVDQSAVQHWLVRHDIPRPYCVVTRRKGEWVMPTKEELTALYEQGKSTEEIGSMFGVTGRPISRLCREYGIPLRESGWEWSKRHSCLDGHLVRSTYEKRVDDWLYQNGIEHSYEVPLPFDTRWHCDFLANGKYIEIWGVRDSAKYAERRVRKVALYRAHNFPLIELSHNQFTTRGNGRWMRVLAKHLLP